MSNAREAAQGRQTLLKTSLVTLNAVIGVGLVAIVLFSLQAATANIAVSIAAFGIALTGASLLILRRQPPAVRKGFFWVSDVIVIEILATNSLDSRLESIVL